MLRTKTLVILLALSLVIGLPLLYLIARPKASTISQYNQKFIPSILQQRAEIAQITLQDQNNTLIFKRENDNWVLTNRANYPVAANQIDELIQGLAGLKIIEPKTSNPALYKHLDLADLSEPGSNAIVLKLQTAQQQDLISLVIGKRENVVLGQEYVERIFIRNSEQQQAWLVQGLLSLSTDVRDWFNQPLLDLIEPTQVKSVVISRPNTDGLTLEKADPHQEDYVIVGFTPESGKNLDLDAINNTAFAVAELEFEDLSAVAEPTVDWQPSISLQIENYLGIKIDLNVLKASDGQVFAKVHASVNDQAPDEIKQRVAEYNARRQPWIYKLDPEFYQIIDINKNSFIAA